MNTSARNREDAARKDTILLERISQGDSKALADLYDLHGRLVYSLAFNTVGVRADAEEVAQEVFLKVWNHAASFDPVLGSPLGWIVTITRRLAIDRTRSKSYKSSNRSSEFDEAVIATQDRKQVSDPTENMVARLQEGIVKKNLSQLGEKQLEVIRLSYYESMSHSEVSEQLGIPLGTVKSRLREAINQLRRIMEV